MDIIPNFRLPRLSDFDILNLGSSFDNLGTSTSNFDTVTTDTLEVSNLSLDIPSTNTLSSDLSIQTSIQTENPRKLEDYEMIRLLGSGGQTSGVWLARLKTTGELVAIKIIDFSNNQDALNFALEEIKALEIISRPGCNLMAACYYGHFYENNKLYIEMEYIDGVDLEKWAQQFYNTGRYNELHLKLVLLYKDMCEVLNYIHSKGLIHRDIKPANILITKENVPKLVDFGLTCQSNICVLASPMIPRGYQSASTTNCCPGASGTLYFMPPEVVESRISYYSSDVWSLATTIFYIAARMYPFEFQVGMSEQEIMRMIIDLQPKLLVTPVIKLNQVVNSSLNKQPFLRPTPSEILTFLG